VDPLADNSLTLLTDVVTKKQHCSFGHEAIEVLLATAPRSSASDVWSLGTVMWEVFSDGAVPFAGMDYLAVTSFVCPLIRGFCGDDRCRSLAEIDWSCLRGTPRPTSTS
jgi:serine/threonine protein kinase